MFKVARVGMKPRAGCFVALFLGVMGSPASALSQAGLGDMAPAAREYLSEALEIMRSQAIHRGSVDWDQLYEEAYLAAAGAVTTEDTYAAISAAVRAVGTEHSSLRPTLEYLRSQIDLPDELFEQMFSPAPTQPEGRRLDGAIGYVRVPGFAGPDPDAFGSEILALVHELDQAGVCGWVVDLRGNDGGNMWPMLSGLTPILGEGVPGYFRFPTGERTPWQVEIATPEEFRLQRPDLPVAVLHNGLTLSSGEAMVVAFRGREGARSFGEPTGGFSTSNTAIPLRDGAVLVITTAVFEDRTGETYGGVIQPDEIVGSDRTIESALDWLRRAEECGGV